MPSEPHRLLREVQAVSKLANPTDPQRVVQRIFDATAKQDKRYASLPLARDIARQLGCSWRDVLALAHLPKRSRAQTVGIRRGEDKQDWITPEYIAYVLKLAARRSQRDTLTLVQYNAERKKMLAAHHKRHPSSTRLRLPTGEQIQTAAQSELYERKGPGTPTAGAWGRALELAALRVRKRRTNTRKAPGQPVHPLKLIELYYDKHGGQPTPTRLWKFADENGLPYVMITSRTVWTALINHWKRQRADRNLPVPRAPHATTHGENALAAMRVHRPPKKRSHSRWRSREKCVAVVAKYLVQLPAGAPGTATSHAVWAREQGDAAPGRSTLHRHGGWTEISELAREQLMKHPPKHA